ncbi:hypothetical protein JOM56_000912 [Amanita muscaria]
MVSLEPEEEELDYTGEAPRCPVLQRSVSGELFSTSLYMPPGPRPIVRQSPTCRAGKLVPFQDAPEVPRDEDSYRGKPSQKVQEPIPRC